MNAKERLKTDQAGKSERDAWSDVKRREETGERQIKWSKAERKMETYMKKEGR